MSFASASSGGVTDALFPDVLSVMQYIQGTIHNGWTTSVVFQSPVTAQLGWAWVYLFHDRKAHTPDGVDLSWTQWVVELSDVHCTAVLAQRVPALSYEEGKRRDGAMVIDAGLDFH